MYLLMREIETDSMVKICYVALSLLRDLGESCLKMRDGVSHSNESKCVELWCLAFIPAISVLHYRVWQISAPVTGIGCKVTVPEHEHVCR